MRIRTLVTAAIVGSALVLTAPMAHADPLLFQHFFKDVPMVPVDLDSLIHSLGILNGLGGGGGLL
ncbi:hypothetical protein GCM10012275_14640 [Longimycelium tulufanense]|uniref:Uncharacterized protein n=1 Tax=Longimycelium tulufanense TaxID=907463 RepID=A0A8J3CDM2_9PSEU|nr:hypothetical protein [Longimycelium tulufanense]GGM44669.1 hypothetical protein GCM10012275_14640 [Longimycelium tulufanense]